ncbi:MAG TPA: methyltransferase domain-containing protein [Patescibacteria group bacterium]|jgi:cyclopropane fatty-acyl-phospholipid synthase-like methyltransferase
MVNSKPTDARTGEVEWFTDPDGLFGNGYYETQVVALSPERTRREVGFLLDHAGLAPGDRVLDIPCGHGRHAVELAQRGIHVTGVDLSQPALARAAAASWEAGVDLRLEQQDTREASLEARFDWAITLFNSLGYGEKTDDRATLRRIASALKPDGALILEESNLEYTARLIEREEHLRDGVYVTDYAYRGVWDQPVYHMHVWNPETRRMQVHVLWWGEDGVMRETLADIRAYSFEELSGLLEDAGLRTVATWGDYDGSALEPESKQVIIKAQLA